MYKLTPQQLSVALNAPHASVSKDPDGIYLVAALKPLSDRVKVAQLQPR